MANVLDIFRSFGGRNMSMPQDNDGRLGDENRGAQMLKRMGWGGAGLGAKEQGREVCRYVIKQIFSTRPSQMKQFQGPKNYHT